jgi:hypothetical protein
MATKKTENKEKKMGIHEKLVQIQQELKAPKNQYNDFSKFHYRSCEDILEAVKPLLGGFSLTLSDEIVQFGNESNIRYYVKATVKLSDGEKEIVNTAYAREAEVKKGMDESQITGAASSYARKYALNGLFTIDDTKDADTMDNTAQSKAASSPASTTSQKDLMEKFGMDSNQKAPSCPSCGATMHLMPRKDGTNLFWSCANWRTKGCKGLNVDDVDIDGNISGKTKKAVSANPQADEDAEDIPF